MAEWVDFSEVKKAVTMQMVLDHYGVKLSKSGSELRGACPFHKGDKKSFQVNPVKNVFNCFSKECKAHGNVLEFVMLKDNCSVRKAALKLVKWFGIESEPEEQGQDKLAAERKGEQAGERAADDGGGEPGDGYEETEGNSHAEEEQTNLPLKFTLQGIDGNHPYLAKRGISQQTADLFGVGFYAGRENRKTSMSGRVVIPIHNRKGELIAYAGRWPGDSGWPEHEDKYKLPAGFKKTLALFNLHRALATESQAAIIVEGFFGCMKICKAGFPFVVGLMGSSMSDEQEQLLVQNYKMAVVLLDPDEAGRKGTQEIISRLHRSVFLWPIKVAGAKQPDKLSSEEIRSLLSAVPFL